MSDTHEEYHAEEAPAAEVAPAEPAPTNVEVFQPKPIKGGGAFPIPAAQFIATLKGTPDEVWSKWLTMQHGRESHTTVEWHEVLDQHRDQPV